MSASPRPATDRESAALADLLDELTAQLQAGEAIDEAEVLRAHPEHADQLRELFPALQLLADLSHSGPDLLAGLLGPTIGGASGTLGDFRILREVGRGGMGVVYEAEQITLGRHVALKVLPFAATMDPRHLQRFQNEARAVASLHHEHIVPVYAVGSERGLHYYAMQFIDGHTLAQTIRNLSDGQGTPPTPSAETLAGRASTHQSIQTHERFRRAAELGIQAAEALEHAHALGIVHRDIKPGNLLIDNQGKLWVTDFGLARTASENDLTISGDVLGTLRYMSPEQALAKHGLVDHRTDVYSLGVTLYELLALQPAVDGRDREEILRRIAFDSPKPLRQINPAIPRELETIILKAIAKEPQLRYQSAEEFAEDLRRFLADRPIRARRTTTWQLLQRWRRRNPALAASMAMLVLVVAIGYLLVTWKWQQEREARNRAQSAEVRANNRADQLQRSLYFQNIARADQEWLDSNVGRADQVLERCPLELRHWEWGYLKRLCHSEFMTLSGHSAEIVAIAFSPDGRLMASGSRDGAIRLWDVAAATTVHCLQGHTGHVLSLMFSPDGRRLVTSSGDWANGIPGEVKVWDVTAAQETASFPQNATMVPCVAFSSDNRTVALAKSDDTLQLIDVENQTERAFRGHRGSCKTVAFSPDGHTLAGGSRDAKIFLWDVRTGVVIRTLVGHTADPMCLAYSPDGTILVSGGWDSTVRVWDAVTGALLRTLTAHQGVITSVAFRPDGMQFATSSADGTVRIWQAKSWQQLATLRGHNRDVRSVAYSPGGSALASAGWEGAIKIWDLTRGQQGQDFPMSTGKERRVVYQPDGKRFAVASKGIRSQHQPGRLTLHDPRTGAELQTIAERADGFNCLAYDHDGGLLATDWDKEIRIWNAQNGHEHLTLAGHDGRTTAVAFHRTEPLLYSGGEDGVVRAWRTDTGNLVSSVSPGIGAITAVAVGHDGRCLAASGKGGHIAVWDVSHGLSESSHRVLSGHKGAATALAFHPSDSRLASAGEDGRVCLWQVEEEDEPIELRGHIGVVTSLGFSPDGRRLASAGLDGAVVVWDTRDGQEALTLRRQMRGISGVAFNPDGRTLLAVGNDYSEGKFWESGQPTPEDSATRLTAWHAAEARGAESLRNWPVAVIHLDRLVKTEPNQPDYLIQRGNCCVELANWNRGIADFTHACEIEPDSVNHWYRKAIAQLGAGDKDGFARVAAEMLARFGATHTAGVASILLHVQAMQSVSVAQADQLLALGELAVASFPGNERVLGAARYRAGRFNESIKAFDQSAKSFQPRAWDWCFLAMCCHQIHEDSKAQDYLRRAADWVAEADRSAAIGSAIAWYNWPERVEIHHLLLEAQSCLRPPRAESKK